MGAAKRGANVVHGRSNYKPERQPELFSLVKPVVESVGEPKHLAKRQP